MSPIHLKLKYFDQQLEVVREFTYLNSTITESLSLDSEFNKRIGKAANIDSGLLKRVWTKKITDCTHHDHGLRSLLAERPLVWQRVLHSSWQSWTPQTPLKQRLLTVTSLRNALAGSCCWRGRWPNTLEALFMASCLRELAQQAEQSFATRMSASDTTKSCRQTSRHYKPRLLTVHIGGRLWTKS